MSLVFRSILIVVVLWSSAAVCAQKPFPAEEEPGLFGNQGYSRVESEKMLSAEVKELLDGALRLYREPNLYLDRLKIYEILKINDFRRVWLGVHADRKYEFGHEAYIDYFTGGAILSSPGWSGSYKYNRVSEIEWHSVIKFLIDKNVVCIDSRAFEGYLGLYFDANIGRHEPYIPRRRYRHEMILAQPYAAPLSKSSPMLSFGLSRGCVIELVLANVFNLNEVSDGKSSN